MSSCKTMGGGSRKGGRKAGGTRKKYHRIKKGRKMKTPCKKRTMKACKRAKRHCKVVSRKNGKKYCRRAKLVR